MTTFLALVFHEKFPPAWQNNYSGVQRSLLRIGRDFLREALGTAIALLCTAAMMPTAGVAAFVGASVIVMVQNVALRALSLLFTDLKIRRI